MNMTDNGIEQLIVEGIKGLPQEALAEIADFIYFVRKRIKQPETYADEINRILLDFEMEDLDQKEKEHLEQEFKDYDNNER
jgi:hypothetical protein